MRAERGRASRSSTGQGMFGTVCKAANLDNSSTHATERPLLCNQL